MSESPLAANMMGTAIINVKSEADLWSIFINTPVEIVDPEREKPGHIAIA